MAADDVSCHIMQNRNINTSQLWREWNLIGLRTEGLDWARQKLISCQPFFVVICTRAKHLVNIQECQGALLWLKYCCATAYSANVISPLTEQTTGECTDFLSNCTFPIIIVDHTQKCHVSTYIVFYLFFLLIKTVKSNQPQVILVQDQLIMGAVLLK